mgnify:CR=1 FL=1
MRLQYTAYVEVTVPNKLARKLKKQEGVCSYDSEPYAWGTKWGDLYYQGEDGKEYKIVGDVSEIDYKRTEEGYWDDEISESDEEAEAAKGSGECQEEEEKEEDNHSICPRCETKKIAVEFKTDLGDGDVMVCEDCYNEIEEEEESE